MLNWRFINHSRQMIRISGRVIKGDGYGKALGYPTANLDRRDYKRRKLKIKFGVYGGYAKVPSRPSHPQGDEWRDPLTVDNQQLRDSSTPLRSARNDRIYTAAIVIGPLDRKGFPKIEAHLLGFKGNLYNTYLNIYLNIYLRPFKKFKNEEELKEQIGKDIDKINKLQIKI